MSYQIKRVTILGSGVMGSGIAAHLANAGIPSYILDIVPRELTDDEKKAGLALKDPRVRNRLALAGMEHIRKSMPALIYSQRDISYITPGNMEDDLDCIGKSDWIIEVVTERLDIKKKVFEQVDRYRKQGSIVSSNTSGIKLKDMADGRSRDFQENFMITHFFNPVRYMKLLEFIVGKDTKPEMVDFMKEFAEDVLGKGVVFGKDTPNFIANRVGVFSMLDTMKVMVDDGYGIDEVDAIVGKPMGRPGSAAFGTGDLVGLDTLYHVSNNVYENTPNDEKRDVFKVPAFVEKMVKQGWIGDKSGQGFYKKIKDEKGRKKLVLDYNTMEYRDTQKYAYDSLGMAKNAEMPDDKMRALVSGDDRAAKFAWKVTKDTLVYAANRVPEIADDIVNVDNAMKWGFNWALGPFETWDAIGLSGSVERMEKEGVKVPENVRKVLDKGYGRFYLDIKGDKYYFDFDSGTYRPVRKRDNAISLESLKKRGMVMKENGSARLIDIGDGVLCVEFNSKMNAIDDDIIAMLNSGMDMLDSRRDVAGMVVANEGETFSAGANIFLVLVASQNKDWKSLEKAIDGLHGANMRMKYASKPVVAAPFNMTLGAGCEVCMHAHRVRAHAELYMGLVEMGVGVIPAGGGTKELYLRALGNNVVKPDPMKAAMHAFETIGMAKVSMSAKEAVEMYGYLGPADRITLNKDNLIYDAKQTVLAMAKEGFKQQRPRNDIQVAGREAIATLRLGAGNLRLGGYISDYDEFIAKKLINVIAGGDVPPGTMIGEERLLDLEREAFLSLCGEQKTQDRLHYMLMNNKPLRN
ncbi:MAG: 3-hydroxyacyl-CoA dehydrogenase/enoyl-CoA hydratase family protein [Deltaproteobacteria bacterium]|nr:3-hydroxyacyl-CoA dehydrogenase/enoyl-CoA hydratase family protein [Deltaproteobacteria bacterium]